MIHRATFFAVAMLATPALAQSSADPARTFESEWSTIVASDLLSAAAHKHTGELAQKLLAEYRAKLDELQKTRDLAAWWESYANGLKAAQADKAGKPE